MSARSWLCTLVLLSGCTGPTRRSCELSPPERVVLNQELGFDGIALTPLPGRSAALYVWSDATGLWAKHSGNAAVASRLAERCRGGVAVTAQADKTYVACSRTLVDPAQPDTEVLVYAVDAALHARELASVGRAGRDGRGVGIAADGQAVYTLFHDGSIGEHTISLATLRDGAVTTTRLSRAGQVASEPSIITHAGHVYATFAELTLRPDGEPASSVWLSRDGASPHQVAAPRAYSPTPKLTADDRGLVLGYRDRARSELRNGSRSELYVARIDDDAKLVGKPRGVGRANTDGEPTVFGCGDLTTALLPREYGGERFVGINALDDTLGSLGAGHQLYATGREFVQASGACVDGAALLFAADRAPAGKPGSEAVALRFVCKQ